MTTLQTTTKQNGQTTTAQPILRAATGEKPKGWGVIDNLNLNLAHVIDLRARTKQAYWSAKGGNFYSLHKMFDDFSDELDAMADELAARVMILGGVPPWTPQAVAATSKLPMYDGKFAHVNEHIAQLSTSYREASRHLLPAMHKFIEIDDHVTAGILTGYAKLLDEQLTFIEAHGPADWMEKPRRPLAS
jgi:starvation-inducible DNA-binding protein